MYGTRAVLISFIFKAAFGLEPLVVLPNGQILGRELITSEDETFYAFEKVPYAAPPLGNLRFKPPQPVSDWEGVLNATHIDVACYQIQNSVDAVESEDCLFLNVYTPQVPNDTETEPLPVMFFIHGGGFVMGWSAEFQPDLFVSNDVVLVTVNYRLGIFGFISTQDEVFPGNNGLKDQTLALQWVQQNIHLFGGNPDKVTIFGQSAGAGSSAYHLLNPNSRGLFNGVILESGSCLSPGMYQRKSREIAFSIGTLLDSIFETNQDSQTLHDFLFNLDAQTLNEATEVYVNSITYLYNEIVDQGSPFAPVIEVENPDAFITKKQYGLLETGNILPIPTLMGFTSEEILFKIKAPNMVRSMMAILDEHLEYIVPYDMQISDINDLKSMGQKIRDIYTEGDLFVDHLGGGIRYGSDHLITRPMIKHAELFSNIAPTYFYQFSYDGTIGNYSVKFDGAETVAHTEELRYLFCSGLDCTDTNYPEADLLTRKRLIKIWTDFAKFQNPTPEPSELLQNITWPQVSIEDGDLFYVDINENLEIKNHPKEETYRRWVELYDSLGDLDFDTY